LTRASNRQHIDLPCAVGHAGQLSRFNSLFRVFP